MQDMPPRARNYVIAVITVGAALFGGCLPSVRFDEPMLFIGLLLISAFSASLKVKLPLHDHRLDDLGVVCRGFHLAPAARPPRNDARRLAGIAANGR